MIYQNINFIKKKKKGKMAAALHYDEKSDEAPRIIARGRDGIAAKIIKMAKEKNIPIEEDIGLVADLIDMDLGENVPPQLYSVIAEILLLIERMEEFI